MLATFIVIEKGSESCWVEFLTQMNFSCNTAYELILKFNTIRWNEFTWLTFLSISWYYVENNLNFDINVWCFLKISLPAAKVSNPSRNDIAP